MAQLKIIVYALIIVLFVFLVDAQKSMAFFKPFHIFNFFFGQSIFSNFDLYTICYLLLLTYFFLLLYDAAKTPCKNVNDCPKAIKPIFVKCLGNFCHYSIGKI